MTFNLLAPCYKRVEPDLRESDPSLAEQRAARLQEIVSFLHNNEQDVICLQEFWFEQETRRVFETALSGRYQFFYKQRPHKKADGLLTLVNKNITVEDVQSFQLTHPGDRVAMLLRMSLPIISTDFQDKSQTGKPEYQSLIVMNTHLTFPHNRFDAFLRHKQVQNITSFVDSYIAKHSLDTACVLLAGDFNGRNDNVCHHLVQNHYTSSHFEVHQADPPVTHLNHHNQQVCVDYIWFRRPLAQLGLVMRPSDSCLLPRSLDPSQWPASCFSMSDHRPLSTVFTLHQPL
mmetsp:Transcript_17716/g.30508  ORF Transcript_17716/g.30508 Transcript_17716/m.30508 type:complete len:288 (+) Transcript_17716:1-864(+)